MRASIEGFSLFEIVITLLIIGILSVVALPIYQDLSSAAKSANEQAFINALSSATLINYSKCSAKLSPAAIPITRCTSINTNVQNRLISGVKAPTWRIDTSATGARSVIPPGTSKACKIITPYHGHNASGQPSVIIIATPSAC